MLDKRELSTVRMRVFVSLFIVSGLIEHVHDEAAIVLHAVVEDALSLSGEVGIGECAIEGDLVQRELCFFVAMGRQVVLVDNDACIGEA